MLLCLYAIYEPQSQILWLSSSIRVIAIRQSNSGNCYWLIFFSSGLSLIGTLENNTSVVPSFFFGLGLSLIGHILRGLPWLLFNKHSWPHLGHLFLLWLNMRPRCLFSITAAHSQSHITGGWLIPVPGFPGIASPVDIWHFILIAHLGYFSSRGLFAAFAPL